VGPGHLRLRWGKKGRAGVFADLVGNARGLAVRRNIPKLRVQCLKSPRGELKNTGPLGGFVPKGFALGKNHHRDETDVMREKKKIKEVIGNNK